MGESSTKAAELTGRRKPAAPVLGSPTVVADNAHVIYHVYEERRGKLREVVSRRFRSRAHTTVHAVRGISLIARRGEAIGVIGRNGSGKSTLLQAIAGALPVSSGSIFASAQPMLLGVGSILKPNLSGARNIMIGLLALGFAKQQAQTLYTDIVEFCGLGDAISRPMRTYSSGMKARLQFAISTAVRPEILLIDEALAVGDADFKERSRARIEELRARAGTVFLVSHSLSEVRATCTRVVWIDGGRVVQEGDPDAVVKAYKRWLRRGGQ